MDNYNFDMQHLLDAFGNDPEKLANAFADSLNATLAEQRKTDYVKEAANDVADAWADFVSEYFNVHELPDNVDEEDFYVDCESVQALLELLVRAIPYIALFREYLGKVDTASQDIKQKTEDAIVAAGKAQQDFADVMAKFFANNNI